MFDMNNDFSGWPYLLYIQPDVSDSTSATITTHTTVRPTCPTQHRQGTCSIPRIQILRGYSNNSKRRGVWLQIQTRPPRTKLFPYFSKFAFSVTNYIFDTRSPLNYAMNLKTNNWLFPEISVSSDFDLHSIPHISQPRTQLTNQQSFEKHVVLQLKTPQ